MGFQNNDLRVETENVIEVTWAAPVQGIYVDAGDSFLPPGYLPFMQNMHIRGGRPISVNGSDIWDTTMDTTSGNAPLAAGQLVLDDGTKYVVVNDGGTWQRWDAAANSWVTIFTGAASSAFAHDTGIWNEIVVRGYLIFGSPVWGNWKWDGTNFLPLGAKIISNMEADQDAQWAGETTEATVIVGGAQSYAATVTTGSNQTLTFTPTGTPIDYSTRLHISTAYTEANASIGFFFHVTDASEVEEAASYFRISTTDGAHYLQVLMDAWIDKATGAAVVLADNTWFHIEVALSAFTETGTFDLTSVADIDFYLENDGAGSFTGYIDNLYIIYNDQMPGCRSFAVWDDVLFGGGTDPDNYEYFVNENFGAEIFWAKGSGPDQWDPLATNPVSRDAGGIITGLHRFYNQIFIGKEGTCHSLGGSITGTVYPDYNYEILDVSTEHGCDGHRSIAEADNKLFFSWFSQIYEYNGTGTKEIGEPVQSKLSEFFDNTPTSTFAGDGPAQRSLVYWPTQSELWMIGADNTGGGEFRIRFASDGRYIETVGVDGADDVELIYRWRDINVANSQQQMLIGIREDGRFVDLDNTATRDFDGTSITRIVRFPWSDAGQPHQLKHWGSVWANFDNLTTGTVTLQYRTVDHLKMVVSDSDPAFTSVVPTLDTDTLAEAGRSFIGTTSRWLQIQFTTTGTGATGAFDLQWPLVIEATPLGRWT